MTKPSEKTGESEVRHPKATKASAAILVFLVLYVLGAGPAWMLKDKMTDMGLACRPAGLPVRLLMIAYAPVGWAQEHTPLHKPLGKYLHLWSRDFDANGDRLYWLT